MYIIFGDHNHVSVLKRAGIMVCRSIVIIEDNADMGGVGGNEINTATITKFLSTEQCFSMAAAASREASHHSLHSPPSPSAAASAVATAAAATQLEADAERPAANYVVETNSKSTMAIMNRSVLNRLSQEKIDREVHDAAVELQEASAAAGAVAAEEAALVATAVGGGGKAPVDKVAVAMHVRAKQRALRKAEAEKAAVIKPETVGLTKCLSQATHQCKSMQTSS